MRHPCGHQKSRQGLSDRRPESRSRFRTRSSIRGAAMAAYVGRPCRSTARSALPQLGYARVWSAFGRLRRGSRPARPRSRMGTARPPPRDAHSGWLGCGGERRDRRRRLGRVVLAWLRAGRGDGPRRLVRPRWPRSRQGIGPQRDVTGGDRCVDHVAHVRLLARAGRSIARFPPVSRGRDDCPCGWVAVSDCAGHLDRQQGRTAIRLSPVHDPSLRAARERASAALGRVLGRRLRPRGRCGLLAARRTRSLADRPRRMAGSGAGHRGRERRIVHVLPVRARVQGRSRDRAQWDVQGPVDDPGHLAGRGAPLATADRGDRDHRCDRSPIAPHRRSAHVARLAGWAPVFPAESRQVPGSR